MLFSGTLTPGTFALKHRRIRVEDQTFQKVILARVSDGDRVVYQNPLVDVERRYPDTPLFFGAGPILGAPQWHVELFKELQKVLKRFILVLPIRCMLNDELVLYHIPVDKERYFRRQVAFERHYMEFAAKAYTNHKGSGALLFNLCLEDPEHPRNDGNPYAMDTRRELGEWYTRLEIGAFDGHPIRICVAADPAFPGLSQIAYCFKEAWARPFPIKGDLAALARSAAFATRRSAYRKRLGY